VVEQISDNACFHTNKRIAMKGNFAAIVLIVVGTFFLLTNLGLLNVSLAALLRTWWPLILIVLGVSMFFSGKR
jgi:hypothetical protein